MPMTRRKSGCVPDYSYAKEHPDRLVKLSSGSAESVNAGSRTITKKGLLFLSHGGCISGINGAYGYEIRVNGYLIDAAGASTNEIESSASFPVDAGDDVTWTGIAVSSGGFFIMEFIPEKT